MRLISRFKDYYDNAQALGTDRSRVYKREPESTDFGLKAGVAPWDKLTPGWTVARQYDALLDLMVPGTRVTLGALHVLFAGKVYRGLRVRTYGRSGGMTHIPREHELRDVAASEQTCFYEPAEASAYLQAHIASALLDERPRRTELSLADGIAHFLSRQGTDELRDWAITERVAVAVLENDRAGWYDTRTKLTVNPSLASIEFFRVFESWQAYQELDMFWGGVLAPESRPMPQIEDKFRIAQHGFDASSFRKAPAKQH